MFIRLIVFVFCLLPIFASAQVRRPRNPNQPDRNRPSMPATVHSYRAGIHELNLNSKLKYIGTSTSANHLMLEITGKGSERIFSGPTEVFNRPNKLIFLNLDLAGVDKDSNLFYAAKNCNDNIQLMRLTPTYKHIDGRTYYRQLSFQMDFQARGFNAQAPSKVFKLKDLLVKSLECKILKVLHHPQ